VNVRRTKGEENVMNSTNLIRVSALALILFACGSESDGGSQSPPPVRGIEGTGAHRQGIQGTGFRTLGIQGSGRNAVSKPRPAESGIAEAGAASE